MNETHYLSILSAQPLIGPQKAKVLIDHFGSAKEALLAHPNEVAALSGFGNRVAANWQAWQHTSSWQKDFELATRFGAQLIPYFDPLYPRLLKATSDHPLLLYVIGTLPKQDTLSIAIVGTRFCSAYGAISAYKIAKELAEKQVTIVSGLARGIDTEAHKGALAGGVTIAALGCGLAHLYPRENEDLAKAIVAKGGALISELPMDTRPDKRHFPRRNRIVSGMCPAAILIEAPLKSGAMITMEYAEKQGRKLYALPGRTDCEDFRGNHMLIKRGRAHLIEGAADVLSDFQLDTQGTSSFGKELNLNPEELALYRALPAGDISFDVLQQKTALPAPQLTTLLMRLSLKGAVSELPGKIFYKR